MSTPDRRDIVERLIDFDSHGNTAIERFTMRIDAVNEIEKIRERLKWLESTFRTGGGTK